ncbi:hypothetical protein IFM89_008606 [Coptis chinensis]|uniref:Peptidase A1 domain-containing protein n=1 Tax=Coptis chinensis TaxID=261450 RepID=A0A835LUW5_9MAGN|nr:hypothetical protein IFM89_008606 [Coptis chinensis]
MLAGKLINRKQCPFEYKCQYALRYGNGKISFGDIAQDTLSFNKETDDKQVATDTVLNSETVQIQVTAGELEKEIGNENELSGVSTEGCGVGQSFEQQEQDDNEGRQEESQDALLEEPQEDVEQVIVNDEVMTEKIHVDKQDARCPVQRGSGVCGLGDQCQYEESYADGTSTVGDIAEDTFSFKDSNGYFICPVVFGCGHENTDTSSKEKFPGVIGLNREPESLVTQLAIKQFAYCFAFYDVYSTTGYIKFGKAASITGLKTPLLSFKNLDDSSYFIDLEGISISGSRIPIPEGTFSVKGDYNETGGVFIDSGAEFTHLNRTGLNILIDEMVKIVDYVRVDHPHKSFQLCYRTAYLPSQSVTFHFKDADMALPEWNTWIQTDPNTVCLAMLPTDDRSVLGSFQQQNYNVGYDWENNVISFQLNYCDDDLD